METSSGGMALKLESLPVKFDGWLQFYVPKPKDDRQQSNNAPAPQQNAGNIDDNIPF
jgi:hypothetical protein